MCFPLSFLLCLCVCVRVCVYVCVRLFVGYMGWYDNSWQMMILVCVGEREKNCCLSVWQKERKVSKRNKWRDKDKGMIIIVMGEIIFYEYILGEYVMGI